jgi:hypothetical protein
MKRLSTIIFGALLAVPTAALAAPQVERLRGTIEKVENGSLTLKTIDGQTESIELAGDTKYALVLKSSLEAIKDGVFIGTATKGDNPPTALEVVIFPEEMRGTGEGHYDWDMIPDTLTGGSRVKSAMTNGTVKTGSSAAPKVKSAMTNGTVASSSGASGEKTLTVTYNKDQAITVAVPPEAPIVKFEAADKSSVKSGAKAFLVAERDNGKLVAKRVAVGKDGLTPPM